MTFVNPAWLLLGLAAAVPVIVHLLRRRIGTRVELPTARYLSRAEAEHSRELRLRNIALLLIRAAAVLLVAVAAARPLITIPGGARAPGSLAIVLDNTLSSAAVTGGASVLEQLRGAARVPLRRLAEGDRAWLITADAAVVAGSRESLLAQLDSVRPLSGRGNLPRALAVANSAVQGSGLPGEVALLTDAQASQWDARASVGASRLVIFAPDYESPPNRAVVEARPEPLRWSGGSGALSIALLSPDSALYRVTVHGETVLRGIAEPDGRVRAPIAVSRAGWFAGTAESERDELPLDDVRHFAAFAGPVPGASVREQAGTYAVTAIETLIGRGRLRPGGGATLTPADYADRLPALLTPPVEGIRIGAANRALERLGVPWRFGAPSSDSVDARADSAFFAGVQPPRVNLRYSLELATLDTARALDTLATVAGEPWIVGGRGYVLVGSALDPDHTSLPVSAAFIPWLERIFAHRLTTDAIGVIEAHPGDTVTVPVWAAAIEGVAADQRLIVPDAPAVHFLTRDGTRVGAIVVNPPRSESLLERLPAELLRQRFDAAQVAIVNDTAAFDRALLHTRGRAEVTGWILLLVALLLVAELIVRSGWRRSRPRAPKSADRSSQPAARSP